MYQPKNCAGTLSADGLSISCAWCGGGSKCNIPTEQQAAVLAKGPSNFAISKQRERVWLDDLAAEIIADSAQNDGATEPSDLNSWMEKRMGSSFYDDPSIELFETGHVEVKINGRIYHLHLVVERE